MVQTEQPQAAKQDQSKSQASNAFRVTAFLLGATIIVDLVYIALAIILNAWQMYVLTGVVLAFSAVTLLGLRLIRGGQSHTAMKLIIGGMLVIFPVAGLLIANIGLVLSTGVILLVAAIATQTLPAKESSWVIIAGIIVGAIILLIDEFGLTYRLSVPFLQTFLPIIIVILLLIYVAFIARQFSSYNLRTKLITSFLVLSVFAVGTVAFFANRTTNAALTENVGNNLKELTGSRAFNIGDLLLRQIDAMRSLTLSQQLRDRLVIANISYGTEPEEIQAELVTLDKEWIAAEDDAKFLIQTRLKNAVATELLVFQNAFPDHTEVFVTDIHGGILATTNRTSDYNQADEEWWQAAYNNGAGAIYVSTPTFDESSNTLGINISLPIYDNDNQTVLGILRSTFAINALSEIVRSIEASNPSLRADILFPDGQILSAAGLLQESAHPEMFTHLQSMGNDTYGEFFFEDEPTFMSRSSVKSFTESSVINDLEWVLLIHQNREAALASVENQGRVTVLWATLIAGIAVVAAVGIAYILAQPIVNLTQVAEQIAGGNLAARAKIETGDEIGVLAQAFNTMADRVNNMVDTLEERVAGRTRQLETLIQVSQRLSGILDLSDLMRQVVILIKETFNYYHVHIYLLDEAGETLIMTEGYGEAGSEMKRQGHSIALEAQRSLVAQSAREGIVVTEENVRNNPDWLPNPLLPNTYSEMAVPIKLGNETVGVLDVQSEVIAGFTPEDEATLQALANQIATAIQNARLFSETQDALYQAQRMQRLYTEQAWDRFKAQKTTTFFERRQSRGPTLEQIETPEASIAVQQRRTVQLKLDEIQNGQTELDRENALATPLQLGNKVIGVLGIRDEDPNRQWTDDEIALIEAVSQQMSLAIENARLFEETQRNAWRDRIVSESTARVWSSTEIEEVMRAAVDQLGNQLGASEVVIRLNTETLDDSATTDI